MTKEEFIKKWNEQSFSEFQSDLTALINSEIENAGKKEPFVAPFKVSANNAGTSFYVMAANGDYVSIDFPSKEQAEWLCEKLNRE